MPIHDWTRVDAGLFHAFHQSWTVYLQDALNAGVLPPDYFALVDTGTCAVATAQPRTHLIQRGEPQIYAGKANRVTVRHRHGKVVAMIEVVSPGNKATRAAFRSFVEKTADLIQQGVHLLVIDLFPPGPRDPHGTHKALWDEFQEEDFDRPPGKPLTLAAYDAGPSPVAYVNFVTVGDVLPEMPLFLKPEKYVPAPLESSYQSTWAAFPAVLKGLLQSPPVQP